jgi:hypothetical protein
VICKKRKPAGVEERLVPHSLGSKFHSKGNCLALRFYTAPDFDKKKIHS